MDRQTNNKQTNYHRGGKKNFKIIVRNVLWTITALCFSFSVNIQYNREQESNKGIMVHNIYAN